MFAAKFGDNVAPHQRPAVAWYQPDVLLSAARRVLSSTDMLRNRDLRESYELPLTINDCSEPDGDGNYWFDFIADTGDGGNGTYAVACAALGESVAGDAGERLPRGELLLLGGDLAYPAASSEEYRYRFIEMFEAARRDAGVRKSQVRGRPFTLAALAQNHDWMDSAATFNRYFVRNKGSALFRLAGDLHHYMRWTSPPAAASDGSRRSPPRDGQLVTCGTGGAFTHPTHTKTTTRPIRLRELNPDHEIAPQMAGQALVLGLDDGPAQRDDVAFERLEATVYPDAARSKRRAWGNLAALFKTNGSWRGGNWWFTVFMGLLYWFNAYLNSLPFADTFVADGFQPIGKFKADDYWPVFVLWLKSMVFSPLGFVVNLVMIGACLMMGREAVDELSSRASRPWRLIVTWGFGLVHAFLHVIAVYSLVFWLHQGVGELRWIGNPNAGAWPAIGHAIAVGVSLFIYGSLVGALIFGCYLALMSYFGYLTNNGYSALGIEDFKGFLRFKIAADATLHAHFVAIERVPRRWKRTASGAPLWEPDGDTPDQAAIVTRVHDRFTL